MRNLIDAEWLKLRTTRMFYGNVLAALAVVPISVSSAIHSAGRAGRAPLDTSEGVRSVLSAASSGTLIVLVIGILVMAGEFRHNTATSTFLIAPDRKRVVAAKLVASSLVGRGWLWPPRRSPSPSHCPGWPPKTSRLACSAETSGLCCLAPWQQRPSTYSSASAWGRSSATRLRPW